MKARRRLFWLGASVVVAAGLVWLWQYAVAAKLVNAAFVASPSRA